MLLTVICQNRNEDVLGRPRVFRFFVVRYGQVHSVFMQIWENNCVMTIELCRLKLIRSYQESNSVSKLFSVSKVKMLCK